MNQQLFQFDEIPAWPYPKGLKPYQGPKAPTPYESVAMPPVLANTSELGIVHIYNPDYPKGGLTIAFRKSSPYKSGVMVDVAVHVCSQGDSFSKKIGNLGAKQKFNSGEFIQLPLLKSYLEQDIAFAVKQAFTALYDTI